MAAGLKVMDESGYGPNGQHIVQLMTRLSRVEWFSALGKPSGRGKAETAFEEFAHRLGIGEYQLVWRTKDQLPSSLEEMNLEESPLWSRLTGIPRQIRDQAEEMGRQSALSHTVENVPEMLFHRAFDGAFRELEAYGERFVQVAVGSVMYIFGLACAWETLADAKSWETNPFISLIDVFEAGHWPVGVAGDQVYMI